MNILVKQLISNRRVPAGCCFWGLGRMNSSSTKSVQAPLPEGKPEKEEIPSRYTITQKPRTLQEEIEMYASMSAPCSTVSTEEWHTIYTHTKARESQTAVRMKVYALTTMATGCPVLIFMGNTGYVSVEASQVSLGILAVFFLWSFVVGGQAQKMAAKIQVSRSGKQVRVLRSNFWGRHYYHIIPILDIVPSYSYSMDEAIPYLPIYRHSQKSSFIVDMQNANFSDKERFTEIFGSHYHL